MYKIVGLCLSLVILTSCTAEQLHSVKTLISTDVKNNSFDLDYYEHVSALYNQNNDAVPERISFDYIGKERYLDNKFPESPDSFSELYLRDFLSYEDDITVLVSKFSKALNEEYLWGHRGGSVGTHNIPQVYLGLYTTDNNRPVANLILSYNVSDKGAKELTLVLESQLLNQNINKFSMTQLRDEIAYQRKLHEAYDQIVPSFVSELDDLMTRVTDALGYDFWIEVPLTVEIDSTGEFKILDITSYLYTDQTVVITLPKLVWMKGKLFFEIYENSEDVYKPLTEELLTELITAYIE